MTGYEVTQLSVFNIVLMFPQSLITHTDLYKLFIFNLSDADRNDGEVRLKV